MGLGEVSPRKKILESVNSGFPDTSGFPWLDLSVEMGDNQDLLY